jgi:hypothetical protein
MAEPLLYPRHPVIVEKKANFNNSSIGGGASPAANYRLNAPSDLRQSPGGSQSIGTNL